MAELTLHRARFVVPVAGAVIENGAVLAADNRIAAVGAYQDLSRSVACRVVDHGNGALIPGLINTHVHLEFTSLRCIVGPKPNLVEWLKAAMAEYALLAPQDMLEGVRLGIERMVRFGTVLFGEVTTTGRSLPLLAQAGLDHHVFFECLGFDLHSELPLEDDFPVFNGEQARSNPLFSAAAHAPYSVSPTLFRRIRDWNLRHGRIGSVHVAESDEEVLFLRTGGGPMKSLLEMQGRRLNGYVPPNCSPVQYLDRMGFLDAATLAVHAVHIDADDREILSRRGTWVVLCPRSNKHTGAGLPGFQELYRSDVRLALGTDSLASVDDFNLFKDIAVLHGIAPEVPLFELLAMATINGAHALGREGDLGSLQPGKIASFLFIPVKNGRDIWQEIINAGAAGEITPISSPFVGVTHGI